MTDEVKVEQIDREAAARALRRVGRGLFGEHLKPLADDFARHRLKAIAEKQESQDGL